MSAFLVCGCTEDQEETVSVPPAETEVPSPVLPAVEVEPDPEAEGSPSSPDLPHCNAPERLVTDTRDVQNEEALFRLLGTKDLKLWARVWEAVVELGPRAVPRLLEVREHGGALERARATDLLFETRTADAILPLYRRAKEEKDNALLARALEAFPYIGADALPALIEALKSKDTKLRRIAAVELGAMGAEAAPALEPLLESLYDPKNDATEEVRRALARLGPVSIPGLIKGLESGIHFKQKRSIVTIGEMGPRGAPAVPSLLKCWVHNGWRFDTTLKQAFCKIGADAIPTLIWKLEDDNRSVRFHAVLAIEAVGPIEPALKPLLIERLTSDPEYGVRYCAAVALANSGPETRSEVIGILLGMMGVKAYTRISIKALGDIGREPERVIPALIETLNDPDWIVRRASAKALAKFGRAASPAVPALLESLEDKESEIREKAILALGSIGEVDVRVAMALMESARPPKRSIRKAVVRALLDMKEITNDAFRAIRAYEEDSNKHVRSLAKEILARWCVQGVGGR